MTSSRTGWKGIAGMHQDSEPQVQTEIGQEQYICSLYRVSGSACVALTLFLTPTSAFAAGGRTFEATLAAFLAFSALVLLVWSVYYFSLHRHFIQRDSHYKRVLLPILGVVALAIGTYSVITGEVNFGRGSSVLRALEPALFWRYVALEFGAGCLLILIGLLYRPERS